MIYPQNFEQKTGFDKVRRLISEKCLSPLGEERVAEMEFSADYQTVTRRLEQTDEFVRILHGEDEFPASYFFDVRYSLKRIRPEGTWLDEKELFDLKRSLQTINDIIRFFRPSLEEGEEIKYPALTALAGDIQVFPQLIGKIDAILDKFGRVKDNASPSLAQIRKEITATMSGISRSLQSILRAAQSEGVVDKDITPTMRDGRLMIPVAPAFKRKIKGIVHDESASGKTVFIEPEVVVEANNRIRELEGDERREIMKILTEFTNFIRPLIPDILQSYEFLAEIDFIRAKALFAEQINGIKPVIEDKQQIDWIHAAHPLLFLSLQKQNKQIVPLDILLEEKKRLLIISGPNAGGKSVCLKTVGLLQYMLQCGLLIPVYESSKTGLFENLFIDIGDEQSIENDLSTYSSHLTNMKFFVKNCNSKTLILIDEFGSGTEPQIGGAIAEALLDRFNRNHSYGVITTHYQNLKHFAEDTEGIVNGAMLYDRHLMQPLFKLSIGNPGSSFAIEIARKIGLPEDVIADASANVGSDYINMDKYLQDIVRDKRYWESKRQNIRQQEKKLEDITARYEQDLEAVNKQRKEIMRNAKEEAQRILSEANAKIENTIREIKEAQAEKERPTLIIGKTVMGKGARKADGSSYEANCATHGAPLGGDAYVNTIKNLGGDPTNPFVIFPEVAELYAKRAEELKKIVAERYAVKAAWAKANPELAAKLELFFSGKAPKVDWAAIEQKAGSATRAASATVLGALATQVENMIVASADLSNSDKTDGFLKKTHSFKKGDFSGAFFQAGVSELSMACICIGMSLHGGVIAACGTFFVFSDYMKPAVRMAALMEQPVKFIWTHDAFRVGEDGPTHEPVEQEAQIRLMEKLRNHKGHNSMLVLRPADAEETTIAWKLAMENMSTPTGLIFSRQNIANLPEGTDYEQAAKGAYIVAGSDENPDVVLVASGSEVSTLVAGTELLRKDGVKVRIVSAPSEGLFRNQSKEYQESVLPANAKIFGLTAGLPVTLQGLVGCHGKVWGLESFGFSAPYKVLDEKLGFTAENVYNQVKAML